jgi:hypothetical protein
MIPFALAHELKNAGFSPSKNSNAVYFINDHLKIRREDALRMWYGDKSRVGLDLDLSKEVVYSVSEPALQRPRTWLGPDQNGRPRRAR